MRVEIVTEESPFSRHVLLINVTVVSKRRGCHARATFIRRTSILNPFSLLLFLLCRSLSPFFKFLHRTFLGGFQADARSMGMKINSFRLNRIKVRESSLLLAPNRDLHTAATFYFSPYNPPAG